MGSPIVANHINKIPSAQFQACNFRFWQV